MKENLSFGEALGASVLRGSDNNESCEIHGKYFVSCIGPDGELKWEDTIENLVTTVAKSAILDAALSGSTYSVTGPYMGLISSVGYGAGPAVGDTMASHAGWVEAGSGSNYPLYTAPRKTCVWAAASGGSKALSAALSFPIITTGGTVKGCFIVFGTGAVNTIADTNGTLYTAGLFSGGDKTVGVGDTLQISYTATIS